MTPLNVQPPEHRIHTNDGSLQVHEIFYTIQGEGPFAGTPAAFVRLAGCNLQCEGCDTDYTSKRQEMTTEQIADKICEVTENATAYRTVSPIVVVITGGEPFRQNIKPLVNLLTQFHCWSVQIETNGTICPADFPFERVTTVVSPKARINRGFINAENVCYKYVARAEDISDTDGLPIRVLGPNSPIIGRPWGENPKPLKPICHIFLQPMDEGDPEKNAANLKACAASCMLHGYQLSVQIHKIANLP